MTDTRPRYRWVVLLAGFVANGAFNSAVWGLPSLGPALRSQFDLSLAQAGLLVTAMPIGIIPVMLLWGMLADRSGERVVLSSSLVGAGAAMILAAFAPSFPLLLGALVLAGMLGGGNAGAGGRAVVGWFAADERGFALTVRQVSPPMAGVAMSVMLPPIAEAWGLRYCFLFLAGLMFAGAACVVALVRDPPSLSHNEAATAVTGSPMADRRLWRLSASGALLIATQGAISALLVIFLHDVRGLSPAAAAAGWALVQAATIPARLLISRLSDRLGLRLRPMRIIALSSAVMTAAMAVLAHGPGELLYPVLLIGATTAMTWNSLGLTAAAELGGYQRAGTAMATYLSVLTVAFTLAAITVGGLVEATSWSAGFALLAVLALASGLLLTRLVDEERDRRAVGRARALQAQPGHAT